MPKKAAASQTNAIEAPKDLENDYEAQGHLRTIIEAHGIINDPEKMKKVHKLAGRHHKAVQGIKSIEELKGARDSFMAKKRNKLAGLVDSDEDGE